MMKPSFLGEAGFSAAIMIKSMYHVKSNVEQEMRMAVFNLIPRYKGYFFTIVDTQCCISFRCII